MEPQQENKRYYSIEEYFALLERSVEKFEYHNGELFMVAGGSPYHNIISANISRRILEGIDNKDCIGFSSDMKIEAAQRQSYVFPDVSVVCGPLEFAEGRNDTIKNPVLIVEVLSPSTEGYDRGAKFRMYRSLLSFREYVLVSQEEPLVEVFFKQDDKSWRYQASSGIESEVRLTSIEHPIALKDIYQKVNFDEGKLTHEVSAQ